MADENGLTLDAIAKLIDGKLSGMETSIMSKVGNELKTYNAKLEAATQQFQETKTQNQTPQSQSKGDDNGVSGEQDAQLAKFKAQAEEALRKVEQANKAREAAEEQARKDRLVSALDGALGKTFPGANAENAKAWLLYHDRVAYDENGNPGIRFKRNFGGYETEEILPLDKGIEEFVGTDQGKSFLPPRNVQGTGDSPRFTNAPRTDNGQVDWNGMKSRVRNKGLADSMRLGQGDI